MWLGRAERSQLGPEAGLAAAATLGGSVGRALFRSTMLAHLPGFFGWSSNEDGTTCGGCLALGGSGALRLRGSVLVWPEGAAGAGSVGGVRGVGLDGVARGAAGLACGSLAGCGCGGPAAGGHVGAGSARATSALGAGLRGSSNVFAPTFT